jgi:hypothetical protein
MQSLDNTQDILDIRDLIERIEELTAERDDLREAVKVSDRVEDEAKALSALQDWEDEDAGELKEMVDFVEQFRGYGGDHQWDGSWFPVTFIRDSYFEEYAEEMARDIGAISSEYQWPQSHIDWEAAAEALQIDYTSGEYDGVTYWAR